MATILDSKQLVSFEELLMSQVVQQEALTRLLVEKGIFTKEEFWEVVKVVDQEMKEEIMKKRKTYLQLTVIMSVLFGIILPLALGIKDPTLIAIFFSSIWFIYAVALFIETFLIEGRRFKKKLEAKEKSDSFPGGVICRTKS